MPDYLLNVGFDKNGKRIRRYDCFCVDCDFLGHSSDFDKGCPNCESEQGYVEALPDL